MLLKPLFLLLLAGGIAAVSTIKSDVYWNYLVTLANAAVDSDAPDPFGESLETGKSGLPAKFIAWASAHHLSTDSEFELTAEKLPAKLAPLAHTGDPRGVPLLRKALMSPNLLIASIASSGLAQAHDEASVPMIIATCNNLPFKAASKLSDALMFDDAEAQKTLAYYNPNFNAEQARKFRANSPFGPIYKTER